MVRGTVEETLNAMLDAEADRLCGAGRYERNEARQDTRAGRYDRTLQNQRRRGQSEGSETAALVAKNVLKQQAAVALEILPILRPRYSNRTEIRHGKSTS